MEGCSSTKISLNFSEMSRTTTSSDRKPNSKINQHLHALRNQAVLQQQSLKSLRRALLQSQNNTKTNVSDTSWTEGYSKFLEDLDEEEFLRDAPLVECRNRVASSTKSLRTRKKEIRRFVSMGIAISYNFALKL